MYPRNQGILHLIIQIVSPVFVEEHQRKVRMQQDDCVMNHNQDDMQDLPSLQENSLLG